MWVTSPDWRSSQSTWLACCASLRQEMVLAALRSAYAPTKTVSVLFTYPSLHITMLTSGLQVSVWKDSMWVSVFSAPGPVGHLSFTEILDTSLKVSWKDPPEKNGILTGTRTRIMVISSDLRKWVYSQPLSVLCSQGIAFPGRNSTGRTRASRITCRTSRRSTGSPVWLHSLPTPFRWPGWPPKVKVSCRPPPFPLVCHQVSFFSFKVFFHSKIESIPSCHHFPAKLVSPVLLWWLYYLQLLFQINKKLCS